MIFFAKKIKMGKDNKEQVKILMKVGAVGIVTIVFFVVILCLCRKWWHWGLLIAALTTPFLLGKLNEKYQCKAIGELTYVLSYQYLFYIMTLPVLYILGNLFAIFLFSYILPLMFLIVIFHPFEEVITALSSGGVLNLIDGRIVFFAMAIGNVICTYGSHYIIVKLSPWKDWGEHQFQKCGQELALYLFDTKNIDLVINFLYCVFLAISGYFAVQDSSLFSKEIDFAVLKAFLVYIAIFNMQNKSLKLKVDCNIPLTYEYISKLLLSFGKTRKD